VISTIGAGDNFSAGILFTLYKTCAGNTEKLVVDRKKIGMLMENGVLFASNVCESTENYISEEFAKEIKG
jgi:fructokinase